MNFFSFLDLPNDIQLIIFEFLDNQSFLVLRKVNRKLHQKLRFPLMIKGQIAGRKTENNSYLILRAYKNSKEFKEFMEFMEFEVRVCEGPSCCEQILTRIWVDKTLKEDIFTGITYTINLYKFIYKFKDKDWHIIEWEIDPDWETFPKDVQTGWGEIDESDSDNDSDNDHGIVTKERHLKNLGEGGIISIKFILSNGIRSENLYLMIANFHNGYYCHKAKILIDGVVQKKTYI